GDGEPAEREEPFRRALFALELPTVFNTVARRHQHGLRDRLPDVVHNASKVATRNVAGDHDPSLNVLSQHHVGSFLAADLSQRTDRHDGASRRVNRQISDALELRTSRGVEFDSQIERRAAAEYA